MRVWRLTKPEHAPGLDGEGARLWGGRWTSPGVPMIYAASSLALAALEILTHLPPVLRRSGALPDLVAIALDLPEADITLLSPITDDDRAHGDAWAASAAGLALRVPSRVIAQEENFLINPRHPGMTRVTLALQFPFWIYDRPRA